MWYTPDIYEVNQFDVKTSPAMGVHNRLRARVRNLGGIPARDVTIRFKYAPIGAGIGLQAFKEIGSVTVDFAAGDGGNEEKIIPIDWDLTNLKEDNGGVWPMSIGAFKHFCVSASVEHPDDINRSNNFGQNCFDDLEPGEGGPASPFRFLVANPFKHATDAELIESPLPDGFRAELVGFPESSGKTFRLGPEEMRVASVKFTVPANFERLRFKEDVVSHLSLKIGRDLVGGVSVRLAKRSAPINVRLFPADFEHVFNAVLSVLTEFHDPVALANRDLGLIKTVSIAADTTRLRGIVRKEALRYIQNRDGRYLLSFRIEKVDTRVTKVTASSLVVVNAIGVGNQLGGQPVGSNGVLERERLDAIATKLAGAK